MAWYADLDDRNGGFFLWIDLSPYLSSNTADDKGWEAEATLRTAILKASVKMASGQKYREERPGWFRVLFSVEKDALEEALRRYVVSQCKFKTLFTDWL
jgi:bifunctional pyridoxal-dependent enzyme with beta-cystathionase and maltose regulon repressor activities